MRGNYKNSKMYIHYCSNDNVPMFPLSVRTVEGSDGSCPHCYSTSDKFGFLGIFGKTYCVSVDCIYHYFDIRKGDTRIKNKKEFFKFIKTRNRELREIKLKRILK